MMTDFDEKDRKKPRVETRTHWVVVAEVGSRMMAEFAVNGLKAHDIPAILDARAGFLGSAGLNLQAFVSGNPEDNKVLVPAEFEREAREIVAMFLGNDDSEERIEPSER